MAGEAKERLILNEQIVGDGPVRIVAGSTVFVDRFMFENEGALFRSVAGEAKLTVSMVYRKLYSAPVDRVTVVAADQTLRDWMVRGQTKLRPGV
jgi:hypothetical protein